MKRHRAFKVQYQTVLLYFHGARSPLSQSARGSCLDRRQCFADGPIRELLPDAILSVAVSVRGVSHGALHGTCCSAVPRRAMDG